MRFKLPATAALVLAAAPAFAENADAIFFGGPILTMNDAMPEAEALAVKDGLFIDVVSYPFMLDLDTVLETNPPSTFGSYANHLKLGGCKLTPDGSPQGKTAWFTTPCLTGGPAGEKDWKGEPGLPIDLMLAGTKKCYDLGLQVLSLSWCRSTR
ncbi:MAG: hypothetical protein QM699_12000 [Amaricoccus sp.]|uniref:hypothetical protein n=1 Tax=Amaricoccus sp. TaxID=1872485 RepID=UPI0039E50D4A